jgi:hypothetical protein
VRGRIRALTMTPAMHTLAALSEPTKTWSGPAVVVTLSATRPSKRGGADRIIAEDKGLRDTALVLCRQRPLHLGESDPLTAQPIERSILGLKEFDGDPLAAMNPTNRDHRQQ